MMTHKKYVYSFLLLLGLTACQKNVLKIYYHDTSTFDGGEIVGSNLELFFTESEGIQVSVNSDRAAQAELFRILAMVKRQQERIDIDDDFYEYAFVLNEKDTLYTNGAFASWRYKEVKRNVKSNIKLLLE